MKSAGGSDPDQASINQVFDARSPGPVPKQSGRSKRLILVGHFLLAHPWYGRRYGRAGEPASPLLVPSSASAPFLPRRRAGAVYHLRRVCLVLLAAARLLLLRSRSDAVFLSVDAGNGMIYVIVLAWIARWLGFRIVLQHHSYAYISRRSRLAAVLVYVCGSRTQHLYSCQLACGEFRRLYPPHAVRTRALSVAYAVKSSQERRNPRAALVSRQLRVGHLSNLTLEKGIEEVIRFGRVATKLGSVERVILAGPVGATAERALIDSVVGERGFEYRGPCNWRAQGGLLSRYRCFLFPTRYKNELSPLVIWEAMLRGVPVIAYQAGCLAQAVLGDANGHRAFDRSNGDDCARCSDSGTAPSQSTGLCHQRPAV